MGDANPHRVHAETLREYGMVDYMAVNWAVETRGGDPTKVPKRPANPRRDAKSNDIATWGTFDEAIANAAESEDLGFGFPAAQPGHPFLFVDLDIPDGGEWVPSFDTLGGAIVERSPTPENRRIILRGDLEIPDWWSNPSRKAESDPDETVEIKLFEDTGYVALTGEPIDGHGPPIEDTHQLAFERFLKDAWRAFPHEGDPDPEPWENDDEGGVTGRDGAVTNAAPSPGGDPSDGEHEEWVDEATARDALSHINPDSTYDEWRNIGFALQHHFDEGTAERLFTNWSRGGSGWDDRAPYYVDNILGRDPSDAGGEPITIAYLVKLAKQHGWDPSESPAASSGTAADGGRGVVVRGAESAESGPENGPAAADDGTPSDGPNSAETWEYVRELYESTDAGTTGVANVHAAEELVDEFDLLTVEETDEIRRFDPEEGIYRDDGRTRVRERLVAELGPQFSRQRAGEILEAIRGRTFARRESFDDYGAPGEREIPVANGMLNLETRELRDFEPDDRLTATLATEYDPDAECPRFREFLDDVSPDDAGRTERQLQEFAGYCLLAGELPFHKSLFIVGPTRAGKTVFVNAISDLLGEHVTTAITPQQLCNSRFHAYRLEGTWLNAANEIPSTELASSARFKAVTGGDSIAVEPKGQDPYDIRPTAKHMFTANRLPPVNDEDNAFFERVLLVTFPETVPEPDRDPGLDDKLAAEAPGILNWALDGLDDLLDRGHFAEVPDKTRELWYAYGSPVDRFKARVLEFDPASAETVADTHEAFTRFCEREGFASISKSKLTRELCKDSRIDRNTKIRGKRAYTGFEIRGYNEWDV